MSGRPALTCAWSAQGTALTIDASGEWTVTENSVLTVLADPSGVYSLTITNIVGNGHNVHYDADLWKPIPGRPDVCPGQRRRADTGERRRRGSTCRRVVDNGGTPSELPNPFTTTTHIPSELARQSYVALSVTNTLGQRVATLVDSLQDEGVHSVSLDGVGLPSGTHFCLLSADGAFQTRRIVISGSVR